MPRSLAELPEGETGIVETLELPEDVAHRLMELGFLPGTSVVAGKSAPGGDPQVFRVDGSEIALRRETTRNILLKLPE
ncbi:MAG: FeoA domain-containing protein [Longimicrobiales bacterium]